MSDQLHKDIAQDFLDRSSSSYHSEILNGWEKLHQKKQEYLYLTLRQYSSPGQALELGSADGTMTAMLCRDFDRVVVVDGSTIFLEQVKSRLNATNVILVHSLFEDFVPPEPCDSIFMTHILEHLDDPVAILRRSQQWLAPNGKLLIAVPNADSLHRLVGVKMGLLPAKDALNQQDVLLGHQRVYTSELLRSHIHQAGFEVEHFGGVMVKPLSNRQIEQQWSDELIAAFFALGEDFPELCSEIYAIATPIETRATMIE